MDAKHQFTYFCLCLTVGFFGGILYENFAFIRRILRCPQGKNQVLGGILDALFCVCFALVCVACSFWLRLPGFRVYMWIAYLLGFLIYLKTLRRTVDFLQKVCYNVIRKIAKRAKTKKKLSKTGDKLI